MTDEKIVVPFLKWAGGKRWLTQHPLFVIPKFKGRYIEPFLGSASIFFHLRPNRSILSDVNAELVETYNAIRGEAALVLRHLKHHAKNHNTQYYYRTRDDYKPSTPASRAARFLYLNRTCWNGLYRVNLKGKFNVPKGTKTNVLLNSDNFDAIAGALRRARIRCSDFEPIIDLAGEGDFVYADPPYTVRHNLNGFIKYNETLFSWNDQIRLKDAVARAKCRGANVIISNANHKSVLELYQGLAKAISIQRASVISGSEQGRGITSELLICL